ncbi:MAG TPA: TIGR00730 family Rossman fold protein [Rhodospirillaceae bacterium]|nr:MAG: Rossman fold protein, TIGR00730 family [Alphaproteobacteria bacterium GWF2_58_20]HAU29339.1 TIGR00730 family Rossman fold protein [Rhodospirillaceae bacterium]
MPEIRSVCVYCGASPNVRDIFKNEATTLGKKLAEDHFRIIYGGGKMGLMGIVADTALKAGAEVVGIIPEHIQNREIEHLGLTELLVVDSMHTRKRLMSERADAFCILPGGLGTLDEFFEIVEWKQLGLHKKPIIIINTDGFWSNLVTLVEHTIAENFSRKEDRELFHVVKNAEEAVDLLKQMYAAQEKKVDAILME